MLKDWKNHWKFLQHQGLALVAKIIFLKVINKYYNNLLENLFSIEENA